MAKGSDRRFSREFKVAALARMEAGANVSALSRELGVRRKCLYQWRERFRLGGAIALRSRGRPTKGEAAAITAGRCTLPAPSAEAAPSAAPDEVARARRRIEALERKVGQQQVELDFFQRALQQVRQARRHSGAPGGTASTRSSKR